MQQSYLEVTFRGGQPLAAYYYLPRRADDRSVRVEKHGPGLLVDLSADGKPLGVEIAIPELVTVDSLNAVLAAYGLQPIDATELAPLRQAA
ncbi:MAG: DUF2283 domain-containing protein [Pirellulaceae bacterium]|nr:DUF2283 domain-containing protein [Pirellulaceae bacterium]